MTDPNHHQQKQWIFDRWAPFYDFPLTSVFYQALHLRLLDHLTLPPQAQILDLGCGTGKLLNRLAQHFPTLQGIGLDLSPEMVAQAQAANREPARLQYQIGNAEALPFEPSQFHAIFCSISFLHYPNPVAVLQEVSRVLKPAGSFYLIDFAPRWSTAPVVLAQVASPIRFYSPQMREQLADKAGLTVQQHQYLLGPVALTVFGKGSTLRSHSSGSQVAIAH